MQKPHPYILIADDDPDDRQEFSNEFVRQNPGIEVMCVDSGSELFRYLEECPLDQLPVVIVLDYKMPELSGPQILMRLAANSCYKQIIKIVWSSSGRTKDVEDCINLGALDYIVKPSSIDDLQTAVQKLTSILEVVDHLMH